MSEANPAAPSPSTPADSGLVQYLANRDVPCPGCGYSMRGLPRPVCPECARELHVSDLGARQMPRWAAVLLGGWGWLAMALLLGGLGAVVEKAPRAADPTLRLLISGGNPGNGIVGLLPGLAGFFWCGWLVWRFSSRPVRRAGAPWVLLLAWCLLVAYAIGAAIIVL